MYWLYMACTGCRNVCLIDAYSSVEKQVHLKRNAIVIRFAISGQSFLRTVLSLTRCERG